LRISYTVEIVQRIVHQGLAHKSLSATHQSPHEDVLSKAEPEICTMQLTPDFGIETYCGVLEVCPHCSLIPHVNSCAQTGVALYALGGNYFHRHEIEKVQPGSRSVNGRGSLGTAAYKGVRSLDTRGRRDCYSLDSRNLLLK
jgi:hypothetical protein